MRPTNSISTPKFEQWMFFAMCGSVSASNAVFVTSTLRGRRREERKVAELDIFRKEEEEEEPR